VEKVAGTAACQVCLTERILSTQRFPFHLRYPGNAFAQHAEAQDSFRVLVGGATPSFSKKSHSKEPERVDWLLELAISLRKVGGAEKTGCNKSLKRASAMLSSRPWKPIGAWQLRING